MNKRRCIVLTLLTVVVLGTFAAGEKDTGEVATDGWKYGVADLTLTHPYHRKWADIQAGVAADFGAVSVFKNSEWNAQQQILDVEALIEQKMDVINVVPLDPAALEDVVKLALSKGIKVISAAVLMEVPGVISMPIGGYDVFKRMGEVVAAHLNYKGNVFFIAEDTTNSESKGRLDGFLDTMKKYPDIKVVEWANAEGDPAKAANITEDWLTKYKDIDFIGFASNQLMVPSIQILKNQKRTTIKTCGFDGEPNGLEAITEGFSIVDGMNSAEQFAWNTTQMAYKLYKGYKPKAVEPFEIPLIIRKDVAEKVRANMKAKGVDLDALNWIELADAKTFGSSAPSVYGKAVTDKLLGF